MYSISVDAEGPIRAVEEMMAQLRVLPSQMHHELDNWQAEDMHRKHPRSRNKRGREGRGRGFTTWIWPRKPYKPRPGARPYHWHRGAHRQHRYSTRPILRWELYNELRDRMEALYNTVKWRRDIAPDVES